MSVRRESWSRPAERGPAPRFVAAVAAGALFVVAWVGLHHGFYTSVQLRDTPVYQRYGDAIAAGKLPYRDFEVEYPPAALPVFAVPSLVQRRGEDAAAYRRVFEALMVACGLAALAAMAVSLAALGAGGAAAAGALAFAALSPLLLGSVFLSRFDLWPAALAAVALAALLVGRERLGAAVLGLAAAAKIYPLVLAPLVAVWVWRRKGPRAAAGAIGLTAGVLAACVFPFAALAPAGVAASVHGQLSRPLQVESLAAAALVAASHLGGPALAVVSSHGSQNIAGSWGTVAGTVSSAVQIGTLAGIWIAFARGPMRTDRLVRYAAAAVVSFVALGKVLSPQYLIWLVPLVPLVRGRRGIAATAVLAVAAVVTQLWFPFRYWRYARGFHETVSWVVLGRDVLLLALLAVLLCPEPVRARARE